jgi:hypothetical protein
MCEEPGHIGFVELSRMPDPMKADVPPYPIDIRLLGAAAEMPDAQDDPQRMQEFRIGLQSWIAV